MEHQHTFTFDGTPQEFLRLLRERGKAKHFHYMNNQLSSAQPFIHNGLGYSISSFPTLFGAGESIHRLEYYATHLPSEQELPSIQELGLRFDLTPRLDERTDIVATCFHPAYEQDFREMMNSLGQEHDTKPFSPAPPQPKLLPAKAPTPGSDGYTWNDVMDWYYRTPRDQCRTINDLTAMLPFTKRTVEKYKELYDAEHGQQALRDDISKFSHK